MSRTSIAQTNQAGRRAGAVGRGAYLITGLAAGAALGRAFGRPSRRPMPHLRTFQRALAATRGEVTAAILAARIQARYDALFAERPRFAHPALRLHFTYQILPGLALYQTLKEDAEQRGVEPAAALTEASKALEGMEMLARWLPQLRRVPFAFALFRRISRLTFLLFPSAGWDIQVDEDSDQRLAFTIRRCFYLDVLTAYGAPELTASYCRIDDIAYEALPPSIAWERSTTLARGGPSCDFCWRAVKAESGRSPVHTRA